MRGLRDLTQPFRLIACGPRSPLVRPPSHGRDPYEPWDMTARERELSTKYLHLMTYHVHR